MTPSSHSHRCDCLLGMLSEGAGLIGVGWATSELTSATAAVAPAEQKDYRFAEPEPDLSLDPEAREPGGLGISLMPKLARDMSYEHREGKNRMTVLIDRNA